MYIYIYIYIYINVYKGLEKDNTKINAWKATRHARESRHANKQGTTHKQQEQRSKGKTKRTKQGDKAPPRNQEYPHANSTQLSNDFLAMQILSFRCRPIPPDEKYPMCSNQEQLDQQADFVIAFIYILKNRLR